jgi:hypothetical protein
MPSLLNGILNEFKGFENGIILGRFSKHIIV